MEKNIDDIPIGPASGYDDEELTHMASLAQSGEQATGGQAPATPHSPLPWRVGAIGGPARFIYCGEPMNGYRVGECQSRRPTESGLGPMSEVDARFIVLAVNHHAELVGLLRAILADSSAYQWHGPIRIALANLPEAK